MKSISNWFCSSSTKKMFVKIIHPGGHVELHDRPILAAELLSRNPRCCVAHPTVFQNPYAAVVSPETTLALGRKYYVVPFGTIRKLRLKHPRGPSCGGTSVGEMEHDGGSGDGFLSMCWSPFKSGDGSKSGASNSGCSPSGIPRGRSREEMKIENKKKRDDYRDSLDRGASPGRVTLVSCDDWQPGLESIVEGY